MRRTSCEEEVDEGKWTMSNDSLCLWNVPRDYPQKISIHQASFSFFLTTTYIVVMPPKSKFRQPGVQHFQLVHRSQRDPLIHDPEASTHVLKAFERGNVAKVRLNHVYGISLSHLALSRANHEQT